jgi:hypothetical protein
MGGLFGDAGGARAEGGDEPFKNLKNGVGWDCLKGGEGGEEPDLEDETGGEGGHEDSC